MKTPPDSAPDNRSGDFEDEGPGIPMRDWPGFRKPDGPNDFNPRIGHPFELGVMDFSCYDVVIDARSPKEFAQDHIPEAINLPVLNDQQHAEVGTIHKIDTYRAYVVGVGYAAINIGEHMQRYIAKRRMTPRSRILVYCFRGGKRSRLWADVLRTVGYEVTVLAGGWRSYRRWVRQCLDIVPRMLDFRVLLGPTGCGKTRLLKALWEQGAQVVDLEELAGHRGSLIGAIPGRAQPSQKFFDTLVFDRLRRVDMERPIWIEGESKRIGRVQVPDMLLEVMHNAVTIRVEAPMAERLKLWREDYPHWVQNPETMVERLQGLKPLIGGKELGLWQDLAQAGDVDRLFERVMTQHYDPCYERSIRGSYAQSRQPHYTVKLKSLAHEDLLPIADELEDNGASLNKLAEEWEWLESPRDAI